MVARLPVVAISCEEALISSIADAMVCTWLSVVIRLCFICASWIRVSFP